MRKLSIVLLVGLMLIGGLSVGVYAATGGATGGDATADVTANVNANTIAAIYIPSNHTTVNLGNITADKYNVQAETWTNLTSDNGGSGYNVYAFTNSTSGLQIKVKASTSSIDSLADLQIKTSGGDPSGSFMGLDSERSLYSNSSAGRDSIEDIEYQYVPDVNDDPDVTYSATLTYTVTVN